MPGRWKDNGSGQAYWDANDTGPDQLPAPSGAPDMRLPVTPMPDVPKGDPGTLKPGDPGWNGGPAYRDPNARIVRTPSNNSEGPGGITGNAQNPDFRQPGVSMPGPTDPKIQPVPFTLTPGEKGDWSMQGGATPLSGSSDAVLAGMQSMYGGAPTPSRTMSAMPAAPAMDATTALRMRLSRDPSNPLLGAIGAGQV